MRDNTFHSPDKQLDTDAIRAQERELVNRCLEGEDEAREVLWRHCCRGLVPTIKLILGERGCDEQLVDEISVAVWLAVLDRDGELLKQFDPGRLITYLVLVARDRIAKDHRSRRRRSRREHVAAPCEEINADPDRTYQVELEEFLRVLTPREREFCQTHLLAIPSATSSFSPPNAAFLKHQISKKLELFLGK